MSNIKFTLRPWNISDLNSLVKHANNFNIAKNLTDKFPHPYTEEAGKNFIAMATKDHPIHVFAIDVNGEAVGGIGIHPQEDIQRMNAELGYWLAEPYWGKGITGKAISQMLDFAFTTYNIRRVFARPFEHNLASQKVLQKNNFKFETRFEKTLIKNGELLDELFYSVIREDWEKRKSK